ncbi:MAG: hypothetical protein PHD67_07205 [Oscillospiraceae bacterium]|nr:hypothetical protein [Oscillospiraceae bacterium]
MLEKLGRITVVTGHYGSGKTNLSVNLAVDLKAAGHEVTLVDLDIVNPYFRSADFSAQMAEKGIRVMAPQFAGTNLDIPALGPEVASVLEEDGGRRVIIDVGGDDAGAFALGRYAAQIAEQDYRMIYVVNAFRYLTRSPEEALQVLLEIETASRLKGSALVNNSNLASETSPEDVLGSVAYAQAAAEKAGLPLWATAVRRDLAPALPGDGFYPVDVYVRPPWERT